MATINCDACKGKGLIGDEGCERKCFTCEGYGKLVIMTISQHVKLYDKATSVQRNEEAQKTLDFLVVGMHKLIQEAKE